MNDTGVTSPISRAYPPSHSPTPKMHPSSPTEKSASGKSVTADQLLAQFGALNPYVLFLWLSAGLVFVLNSTTVMLTVFVVGNTACNLTATNTNCVDDGSLAAEFNLSGGDAGFVVLTSYMMGIAVGGLVFTSLSDRVGRHKVMCASTFAKGAAGMGSAFTTSVYGYVALRWLQGLFATGSGVVAMVLAYESTPITLRPYATMLFGLGWLAGYCLVAPMAYWLPNWRHLTAFNSTLLLAYAIFLTLYVFRWEH